MNKLFFFYFLLAGSVCQAQPGGRPGNGNREIVGRFYGKVLDEKTGKAVEFAVIQISRVNPADSADKALVSGTLSETNGDFSLDDIPAGEHLQLTVYFMGYEKRSLDVILEAKPGSSLPEKDLGNLVLKPSGTELGEVVIDGTDPTIKLDIDKRVFNVDKNDNSAGGTGIDVMRTVPSLQVDVDGNISLRGTAPTIFIDGRPSTLTLEQIPADAIQSVEVITNPSAKYDASGGMSGIVNVVLKRSKAIGYNGSTRLGADSRGRINAGIDLNARHEKINFFLSGNLNQRKNKGKGHTERLYYPQDPDILYTQDNQNTMNGFFAMARGGVDWFADNRNTFTLSQSINRGRFAPEDSFHSTTDTLYADSIATLNIDRNTATERNFQNLGTQFLYKHIFAREGRELTADVNFSAIRSEFDGLYYQEYNGDASEQTQHGSGKQSVITSQVDFKSPMDNGYKLEAGARESVRFYLSEYKNYELDPDLLTYIEIPALQVNYQFTDQVYAAYGTWSHQGAIWGWQTGLRAERSDYTGELLDTDSTFSIQFPVSLFPSGFLAYSLSEKQNIQLNYSRRVSRPGFMRMVPFIDYSDSLNLSKGNPSLKPEFTNSIELSYQNVFSKQHNLLISVYYKQSTDLVTRYLQSEYNDVLGREVLVSTWLNASSSQAAGLEIISRDSFVKWFELTSSVNFYQSAIDGQNIDPTLTNERFSWNGKLNAQFKLPKNISFQISADYSSRRAMDMGGGGERGGGGGGGGGMGGGGGGMFGGSSSTAQGYVDSNYGVDTSVRYEFMKRMASISLSMSDVLKTRRNITYSESAYFTQTTESRRDWQVIRVNLSFKFGKMDTSLFRRKNTGQGSEGGDMGM